MFHQWHKFVFLSLWAIQTICFGNPQIKIHLDQAKEFEENDQLEEAIESAKKAISKIDRQTDDTQVLEANKLLIRLSYDSENYTDTIKYAQSLIGKDKSNDAQFFGRRYLGHAFMDSNRSKKAIRQYETALKISSKDKEGEANIYFNLGGVFWDLEDFNKRLHLN